MDALDELRLWRAQVQDGLLSLASYSDELVDKQIKLDARVSDGLDTLAMIDREIERMEDEQGGV